MTVGLFIAPIFYKIGTGSLLNSFFSTIFVRLEHSSWGSVFPVIMNELYNGVLPSKSIASAQCELVQIRAALSDLPPNAVVWDFENLANDPPWGDDISPEIRNMADYYVTSDGRNLLNLFDQALATALELDEDVVIRSL